MAVLALVIPCLEASAQAPDSPAEPGITAADASPQALARALETAFRERRPEAYAALWKHDDGEAGPEAELAFFRERMHGQEIQATARVTGPAARPRVLLQLFMVAEPRGRLEEWSFVVEPRQGAGWAIRARRPLAEISGLSHLTVWPEGYRADGRRLQLEDFELEMRRGTLFTSPPELGPTAITFVGDGVVRFRPRPEAEQQQLRQYTGATTLETPVRAAFARLHPADFSRVLAGGPLEPDPGAEARRPAAEKFHLQQAGRLFVLDAPLPRSPWWLLPAIGDAAVAFATRRHGVLTYTLSRGEPESIGLADRAKRRQICLYPLPGRDTDYDEDAGRPYDVAHHYLRVRVEPREQRIEVLDDVTLDVRSPVSTVQLTLADALRVHSVSSAEGGDHLFFRVRHQNRVLVSLGALAGRTGKVTLRMRYGGIRPSDEIDRELQGARVDDNFDPTSAGMRREPVLVYTNRVSWYPQAGTDDYATFEASIDVPADFAPAMGGELLGTTDAPGRRVYRFNQDRPAKYLSLVVGKLVEAPSVRVGDVELRVSAVRRARGEAVAMTPMAADILRFLIAEFGPFPYRSLQLVFVDGRAPGGHSPPGMVVMTQLPPFAGGALRPDPATFHDIRGFFLAHEIAHQWWGQAVAGQNYRERWISEAMAQYAAARWARQAHGEKTFQEVMRRMSRWARRFNDGGPIHLGQRLGHVRDDGQVYRAIVYDKGALVLHMLRDLVGDEPFLAALRSVQADHRFRKIGTRTLQRAFEQTSGKSLGYFFDGWIYGTALAPVGLAETASDRRGPG